MPYRRARWLLGQRAHTVRVLRASWQACSPAGERGASLCSGPLRPRSAHALPLPEGLCSPDCTVSRSGLGAGGSALFWAGLGVAAAEQDAPSAAVAKPRGPKTDGPRVRAAPSERATGHCRTQAFHVLVPQTRTA